MYLLTSASNVANFSRRGLNVSDPEEFRLPFNKQWQVITYSLSVFESMVGIQTTIFREIYRHEWYMVDFKSFSEVSYQGKYKHW